jgi:DNA-binding XRE family transcriptional regulator
MKAPERGTPRHEELRHLLKQRRQKLEMTQRELATLLGWDHKTVYSIESGGKNVTLLEFLQLAEALDFDAPAAVRRIQRR